MLFRVSNLGPIREAQLDLSKELIILAGPNNAGKTYLTWAVYGLAQIDIRHVGVPTSLLEWARRLIEDPERSASLESLADCSPDILTKVAEHLQSRLAEEFAAPPERFETTRLALSGFSFSLRKATGSLQGAWSLHVNSEGFILRRRQHEGEDPAELVEMPDRFEERIARMVLRVALLNLPDRRTAAFPVERLAINLFARELAANRTALVDELVGSVAEEVEGDTDLRDSLRRRAGRYPRAIRDALQRALRMRSDAEGDFADLADELEREVLGGKLSKTEFDEIQFTPTGPKNAQPLGLHQSASVIKSLASLVWHLRYEARKGERLIIDEPELNLHPDNQRRVARVLAKAVNRGLKVMLSTHSDYFVRELNNLIMLSQDSDAARGLVQELGVDPLSTIRPDKLGVYLVQGGECRAVPVTDTGFEVKTIDEEIHRLNRDSQTIYSRLFDE